MKVKIRQRDLKETLVRFDSTPTMLVTVRTFKSGTVVLELSQWEAVTLAQQIGSSIKAHRDESQRRLDHYLRDVTKAVADVATA